MADDELDPKGLIRESYRIEGIRAEECRSIFFDWALGLPVGADERAAVRAMLERHGDAGHPMTAVLQAALEAPKATGRRGGRAARLGRDP